MFMCFFLIVMFSAFEKLYRKHFSNHLSFQNIFNTKALTTKLFFNNYVFLKKVERILKKQQIDTYLEMVSFYYEVDI